MKSFLTRILINLFLPIFLMTACYRSFRLTMPAVSGIYQNSKHRAERLELLPDGRFVKTEEREGRQLRSEGRWQIDRFKDEEELVFRDASGIWVALPERSFSGRIRIPVSPDENEYLYKQK